MSHLQLKVDWDGKSRSRSFRHGILVETENSHKLSFSCQHKVTSKLHHCLDMLLGYPVSIAKVLENSFLIRHSKNREPGGVFSPPVESCIDLLFNFVYQLLSSELLKL